MALINRITRLFAADFHAVLDGLEEPKALLKHSIREMEECQHASRIELENLAGNIDNLENQIQKLSEKLKALDKDLDICLESGNDDLARSHVRRKLETQRLREHQERKLVVKQEQHSKLQNNYETNHQTLTGLKQKAELFTESRHDKVTASEESPIISDFHISREELETALLGEKRQRTQS